MPPPEISAPRVQPAPVLTSENPEVGPLVAPGVCTVTVTGAIGVGAAALAGGGPSVTVITVVASTSTAEIARKASRRLRSLDLQNEVFPLVLRGTQLLDQARDSARRRSKRRTTGACRSGMATPAHLRIDPGRAPGVGAAPSAPGTCSAGQRTATITALTTASKDPCANFLPPARISSRRRCALQTNTGCPASDQGTTTTPTTDNEGCPLPCAVRPTIVMQSRLLERPRGCASQVINELGLPASAVPDRNQFPPAGGPDPARRQGHQTRFRT